MIVLRTWVAFAHYGLTTDLTPAIYVNSELVCHCTWADYETNNVKKLELALDKWNEKNYPSFWQWIKSFFK